MSDDYDRQVAELVELTSAEMDEVQGGDVVPTDQVSLYYSKIEFESAQSAGGSDNEYRYVSIRRF